MRLYDIHTHILHGVDDGARQLDESKGMLEALKKQGITDVVLTPHYYPFEIPVERFVELRNSRYSELLPIAQKMGITLHLGAEVFYSDILLANNDINDLCIDGGDYLLVELPFQIKNMQFIMDSLIKLSARFSVNIIIAHIDRYPRFFNKKFLRAICAMNCFVQVDIKSFSSPFLRQKILKYVKHGLIHCAGTDCHNLDNRAPNIELLRSKADEQTFCYLLNSIGEKIDR